MHRTFDWQLQCVLWSRLYLKDASTPATHSLAADKLPAMIRGQLMLLLIDDVYMLYMFDHFEYSHL